jgi:fibronectin type 3 domain-containing protein
MKRFVIMIVVSAVTLLSGCSKEHDSLPTSFMYDPPPTPTTLEVASGDYEATLTWDYPAEEMGALEEFRIYYYYEVYDLLELVDRTNETTYTDSELVGNLLYCYRVSAVDTTGLEGYRTETVCVVVDVSSQ